MTSLFPGHNFFLATHLSRNLDSGERKHVDGATQFINGFVTLNGRIPDNSEFEHGTDSADAAGYRFNGKGYHLHRSCTIERREF
jgi:hypothetical protein